jgi:hypothetical protein
MDNCIDLSFPNHPDENSDFPIEFEVSNYNDEVCLFIPGDDRLITLTHAQFEEAIQHYIQVKAIQASKDRMKSNNTIVDYSKGGFIPKSQPCPDILSDGKEA